MWVGFVVVMAIAKKITSEIKKIKNCKLEFIL